MDLDSGRKSWTGACSGSSGHFETGCPNPEHTSRGSSSYSHDLTLNCFLKVEHQLELFPQNLTISFLSQLQSTGRVEQGNFPSSQNVSVIPNQNDVRMSSVFKAKKKVLNVEYTGSVEYTDRHRGKPSLASVQNWTPYFSPPGDKVERIVSSRNSQSTVFRSI